MGVTTRWRKSSRTQGANNCVEVAHTKDALRDSKHATVEMRADVPQLLAAVKARLIG